MAMPFRPALQPLRGPSRLRVSGFACIAIALALAGCGENPMRDDPARGVLRIQLTARCMENLPAGPTSIYYNDWDDIVAACDRQAYYLANGCGDPSFCLRVMFPASAIEARQGGDGLPGSIHESAAPKGDAHD